MQALTAKRVRVLPSGSGELALDAYVLRLPSEFALKPRSGVLHSWYFASAAVQVNNVKISVRAKKVG